MTEDTAITTDDSRPSYFDYERYRTLRLKEAITLADFDNLLSCASKAGNSLYLDVHKEVQHYAIDLGLSIYEVTRYLDMRRELSK